MTTVGVFGSLILLLAGPWSSAFVSPGDLASAHQGIDTPSGSCVACHTAANQQGVAWIRSVFAGPGRVAEGGKCLRCHFLHVPSDRRSDLWEPHSVAGRPVTGQHGADTATFALGLASLAGRAPQAPLGCAVCHHEHRGVDHDLTRMNDTSCQVCHRTQFASFSRGHPAFLAGRPTGTGIRFDHDKHRGRLGQGKFDCLLCHAPDATGTTMVLLPFESSCTGCHSEQIERMRIAPLDHLRLHVIKPGGDSYWPDQGFAKNKKLSSIMQFLLSGDENVRSILKEFAKKPPRRVKTAERNKEALAGAIKKLIVEILCGDLRPRLGRALGLTSGSPVVEELSRQIALAAPAVLRLQKQWLEELPLDPDCLRTLGNIPSEPGGMVGWRHDPKKLNVTYGATGHADPLVMAWLDAIAEAPVEPIDQALRDKVIRELERSFSACLQCHEADSDVAGLGTLSWRGKMRETSEIGAHRPFVHRTHRNEIGLPEQTCGACHKLASDMQSTVPDLRDQPNRPTWHGFVDYDQADCASCHRPGHANDSCLTCHYYHVTRP